MKLDKLTTLLVVDRIEPVLPIWQKLGYKPTLRVPEQGPLGFVILNGPPGELMLQTRASLEEDMPDVARRQPSYLLYGDVGSLAAAKKQLAGATVIIAQRTTFYGATETWLELADGGPVIGLAQRDG